MIGKSCQHDVCLKWVETMNYRGSSMIITHSIHRTGIFTCIWLIFMVFMNVGIYIYTVRPMDPSWVITHYLFPTIAIWCTNNDWNAALENIACKRWCSLKNKSCFLQIRCWKNGRTGWISVGSIVSELIDIMYVLPSLHFFAVFMDRKRTSPTSTSAIWYKRVVPGSCYWFAVQFCRCWGFNDS